MDRDGDNQVGRAPATGAGLSLAEILASLSYALDLTGGQPMGHAQRTCLIGMRIASELRLDPAQMDGLYYALLIKDAGCSSTAARMGEIFGGDDIAVKRRVRRADWKQWLANARCALAHALLPDGAARASLGRLLQDDAQSEEASDALLHVRGERGADIARALGLGDAAAQCLQCLDEHWDGEGGPHHLEGDGIPLPARIACLAQTLEVFTQAFDVETAYAVVAKRSGQWFDPELVRLSQAFRYDSSFWRFVRETPSDALLKMDVGAAAETISEARIDVVCRAFAQVVDAKSPFTAEHSSRVSVLTGEIAGALGIVGPRLTTLRRSALLHDIGKLAVPNAILDKPAKLNRAEWECVKQHPYYSEQILSRIAGFKRMSVIAAAHHERLDGSGYFRGLRGGQLDLDMRILAVADVFDALSARRPYREALPPEEALLILNKEAGVTLDAACVAVLNRRNGASPLTALAQVQGDRLLAA